MNGNAIQGENENQREEGGRLGGTGQTIVNPATARHQHLWDGAKRSLVVGGGGSNSAMASMYLIRDCLAHTIP